jgi:nitrosocyanin
MKSLPLFCALSLFCALASSAYAETRTFNVTAVEVDGTKFWLPANLIVKKGDTVKIHAVSKVPGQNSVHGFAIDAFKIQEVVDTKGKDITFTADKAGIFDIRCQLHPAHVGGQLLVIE